MDPGEEKMESALTSRRNAVYLLTGDEAVWMPRHGILLAPVET